MKSDNLSKELCEICGIGYIIKCKHGEQFPQNCDCDYSCEECSAHQKIFPDFEKPENYKKLQEIFINNGHSITLSKDWYAISNGDTDFVTDMYDTSFEIIGKTFLKAVCNYLRLWIEEITQEQISYGIYSEPINTSHKLTREECIYPRGYDDLLKDVERIKQAIRETEWVYE